MPAPIADTTIGGAIKPVEAKHVSAPHESIDEKIRITADNAGIHKVGKLVLDEVTEINPLSTQDYVDNSDTDYSTEDVIIVTGSDAAKYLLPMRDDHEPALTFRSLFLATVLSAFQAVMSQIYSVS